jgi:hypothetical protein
MRDARLQLSAATCVPRTASADATLSRQVDDPETIT